MENDYTEPDSKLTAIGQRLRHFRKRLGMSQKEFVRPLDIEQSTLSHIERGDAKYKISRKTEKKLVTAYKVNINYLLNGTGPMILDGQDETLINLRTNREIISMDDSKNEDIAMLRAELKYLRMLVDRIDAEKALLASILKSWGIKIGQEIEDGKTGKK